MKPNISAQTETGNFWVGHAEHPDWERAAEQCLQQIGYIPPGANVGFVYVTDIHAKALDAIASFLRVETGITDWLGTVGMGICATGREYHETAAMAVLVARLPAESFRILPPVTDAAQARLTPLQPWLAGSRSHLAIVHGDPRNAAIPNLVSRLSESIPGGFLVGGLSSSRADEYPQIAGRHAANGLSGVVFNDRLRVATGLTQGCSPLAERHVVTECERNIIAAIDGRPALDVLKEDIGEILARDLARAAGYIFVGLPVAGSDTGDYLVRNLIGIDPERNLVAIGELVEPGQSLLFCRRDGATAWQDLRRMLNALKRRIDCRPKGGLYYSCVGRGQNLFGDDSEELRTIRHELGDFPLAGFFANGEISHNRLYGYTGVLTLFL
jgi:small ligand-binding sensory domain FIST